MKPLNNKTTFITGASSGIGRACAELFAEAGSHLILCARSIDKLEQIKSELSMRSPSCKIHIIQLDVTKKEEVENKIKNLPEEFQQIHILINNAGLARGRDKLQDGRIEDWEEMIDTNIKGALYITRAILPNMVLQNTGTIINIGSIAGRVAYPSGNVYCATKAAIRSISDGLRIDVVDTNLRISTIEPGIVETNFSLVRFRGDKDKSDQLYQSLEPLQAKDIADAALYIATRPPYVQINEMLINPTCQATATIIHHNKSAETNLKG